MRQVLGMLLGVIVALGSTVVSAAPPAATQPAKPTRVLVLPLDSINPMADQTWIGPAVQQSLLAEFATVRSLQAVTVDASADQANGFIGIGQAIELGRDHAADFVLFGSFQTVEPNVRITAQVLSVEQGEIVGGLRATGPMEDLFLLQDQLADQAKRVMLQRRASRQRSADAPADGPAEPRLELAVTAPLTVHNDNPYYDRASDRRADWMDDGPYLAGRYQDGHNDYFYDFPPAARYYGWGPYRHFHWRSHPWIRPYAPPPGPYWVP